MTYRSADFINDEMSMFSWVEERYLEEERCYGYVVMFGEIKEGLDSWKAFMRGEGSIRAGDIKAVTVETRAFRSGEPAFRYALETVGKDPSLARSEYEKFLAKVRPMEPFDPTYQPRTNSEKEK